MITIITIKSREVGMQPSILQLIECETAMRLTKRGSKEYHGNCPFCQCTSNQFVVFATGENERYWCRNCDRKGDAIQFLRDYKNMSYSEAVEALGIPCRYGGNNGNNHNGGNDGNGGNGRKHHQGHEPLPSLPPSTTWVESARTFLSHCQDTLHAAQGARARDWLQSRGLHHDTIARYGLGYNDHDHYVDRESWGLAPEQRDDGRPKQLWLPRGVVIPWSVDGELWGLRVRRPKGQPKYYWMPGGTANLLYNADAVQAGGPVVLLEGEIDALTIAQAGYAAVATGSTHAARRTKWAARLSLASTVLVAYDADDAGNQAAGYWLVVLPNAKRWRPYWSDANQLQQDGVNVADWIAAGLRPQRCDDNNGNDGYRGNGPSASTIAPVALTVAPVAPKRQLPRRYYELVNRPLMADDAAELRALAAVHGVDLKWQRIELN